jgi:hypothetical protein
MTEEEHRMTTTETRPVPAPEPARRGVRGVGFAARVIAVLVIFVVVYVVASLLWASSKGNPSIKAPAKDIAARLIEPGLYAHDVAAPLPAVAASDLTSCQTKFHAQSAGVVGDVRNKVSLLETVVRFGSPADATAYLAGADTCTGTTVTTFPATAVPGADEQVVSTTSTQAVLAHIRVGAYVIDVKLTTADGVPDATEVGPILTQLTAKVAAAK